MQKQTEELNPCEKCGAIPEHQGVAPFNLEIRDLPEWHRFRCDICNRGVPWEPTIEQARKKWNDVN
jgi:hypothetical protein